MNRFTAALAVLTGTMLSSAAVRAQQARICDGNGELAMLIGTVSDRATRVPLAGALITAGWAGADSAARARTDSVGKARICAPPERSITLRVSYHDVRAAPQSTFLSLTRTTEHTFAIDVPAVLVRGVVAEKGTGAPVHNVAVRIVNTPLLTMTDAEGKFYFERVPIGDYALSVEHISYGTVRTPLNVRGEDLDAAIRLTPKAIALEPVVVTAFSRRLEQTGFYEREKRGVGTFLGRRQIQAMNVQRASDLLRRVPSARIIPQTSRRNVPPNATMGRGNCRYRFIIDGAPTLSDFEMDFIAPYVIEGVEVYNGLSEVPVLFRAIASPDTGSPLCGVVVIWTKDRR